MQISASGYPNGQPVRIDIIEDDIISSICSGDPITTINTNLNNNFASTNWIIPNGNDGIGNLEYCFKATIGSQSIVSTNLDTLFGHNGWDCDATNQCSTGLVCDGNAPAFDTEDEGCCLYQENWNTNSNQCRDAVKGKIYQVTQNGQSFNEAPYGNLKLRVFFIQDYLPLASDTILYFDTQSDVNGNFAFNPEKYHPDWNLDILDVEFKIHSIFAFEGTEAIGKWTNQFSNKEKLKSVYLIRTQQQQE